MVANYRCTELKEEALQIVQPQVLALKAASEHLNSNFKQDAESVVELASSHYNKVAKQYD